MITEALTNKQAIAYISNKKLTPTGKTSAEIVADWSDDDRARAFFSSRVTKVEVLETMRHRITQVIAGAGTTQQAQWWIREFLATDGRSALKEMGFLADEAEMNKNNRLSELGSARRIRLIIEQNVDNARAASEYDGLLETKDVYPYGEYHTAEDGKVRPGHAALDGNIYEIGSPELRRVYPPNDFRCRCNIRPIRKDELNGRKIQRTAPPVSELSPSGFSFDPAAKPEPLPMKPTWSPEMLKAYAGTGKITPEIRQAAKEMAKKKFTGQIVKNIYSGQDIRMAFSGAKHTISQSKTCVGLDLLDSAEDIAANGEPKGFEEDKDRRQNIKGVWRFEKTVPTRAGMVLAELIVRETTDGMLFYHLQGVKKQNPPGQSGQTQ